FIYRVHLSYGELVEELGKAQLYWLNPLYWVLNIYFRLYALVEASFSRLQELRADRIAVEAYGRQLFGETLPASALEATFFSQVGLAEVWELTQRRQQLPNVYHYVAVMRRAYEREHPDRVRKILSRMLAQQTRAFD